MRRSSRHAITTESQRWVDADIITPAQAEQICALYPVDDGRRGHGVLTILGYVFIALALITLIGANWNEIPRAVRMLSLVLLTLGTHGFALRRLLQGQRHSAIPLFFLGNAFYGVAIILIAQIYHLGEHMPDGVLMWAVGCAPFALLLRDPWLMLQTLALAMLWAGLQASFGYDIYLFPAFLAATLYVLAQPGSSRLLFTVFLVSLVAWLNYLVTKLWTADYHLEPEVELFFLNGSLLLVLAALGTRLRSLADQPARNTPADQGFPAKEYGTVLLNICGAALMGMLLVMTFLDPWQSLLGAQWHHPYALVTLVVLFGAMMLYFVRDDPMRTFFSLALTIYLVTMAAVLVSRNEDHAVTFQVAMNLLFVGLGIALLWHGLRSGSSRSFKVGLGALLLIANIRYFDLVGNYVGAAVLFLVFALLMLGAAQFWKRLHGRVSE